MDNRDLSFPYNYARQNLAQWRTRYASITEYLRAIVRNMMCQGYALNEMFNEYHYQSFPSFGNEMEATVYLRDYHKEVEMYRVFPILDRLLDTRSDESVAGLCYSDLIRLVDSAEVSQNLVEELEYTYLSDFLQHMSSLMWMALCLSGKSEQESLTIVSCELIEDNYCFDDCTSIKKAFRGTNVEKFLARNYMPMPPLIIPTNNFATNFAAKILDEVSNQKLESVTFFNPSKKYDDSKMLEKFRRDFRCFVSPDGTMCLLYTKDVLDKYILTSPHPYVCSEIARNLLESGDVNTATIFIQEALVCALSVSNPYWDNPIAICGCASSLLSVCHLLSDDNLADFEMCVGKSLRRALQLYLLRAIAAIDQMSDVDTKLYGLIIRKKEFQKALAAFGKVDSDALLECYKKGDFVIPIRMLKELMLFVRLSSKDSSLFWLNHISEHESQARLRKAQLLELREKEYTVLDKHLLDFFVKKSDYKSFEQIADEKGIRYLYHVTKRSNLQSIIENKGLYSWGYSNEHGIQYDSAVGTDETREKDAEADLDNYVRLSLCDDYPTQKGKKSTGEDYVLLKVKRDAIWSKNTLFADRDATDKQHLEGPGLSDFLNIDFEATSAHNLEYDDPRYQKHLAEIMVKEYIPISYIVNIEDPDTF